MFLLFTYTNKIIFETYIDYCCGNANFHVIETTHVTAVGFTIIMQSEITWPLKTRRCECSYLQNPYKFGNYILGTSNISSLLTCYEYFFSGTM